jgi:hypothetical protein
MVDDLEERLIRYRADLDAAVAADLARRHLASREAGSHQADLFPPELPVQFTEEDATTIDVKTASPTEPWQKRPMRALVAGILTAAAAAAVVVVAALALRSSNDPELITPADTAVTSSTELVVRPLDPPFASPELTAHALEIPIACNPPGSPTEPTCPNLAVSPDGTLVAFDPRAGTLTWYEDEPRVVPLTAELPHGVDGAFLVAIGPHDIAYIANRGDYVAVAPSGAEITRVAWTSRQPWPAGATATGLVTIRFGWPSPKSAPDLPWVDLDGNPITDTRPYPTAKATNAGLEIRLGEREWLIANEPGIRPVPLDFLARSDGGVVMVLDTWNAGQHRPANLDEDAQAVNVLELLPDGTIERYFVDTVEPPVVLPDGSLIVVHNSQLVRLTAPR